MRCLRTSAMCSAGLTLLVLTAVALPSLGAPPTARIEAVNSEPKPDKKTDISALQAQISDKPRDRKARFRLVMALRAAGRLQQALTAAKAWRAHDAYNLLVVRLIGDLHAALGDRHAALRSWSSVVELLPNDASAHRALASALKQAGAIGAACQRLARAVELHPDDTRLRFESADCSHRLGKLNQAKLGFEAIAANDKTPKLIRAPTLQRLAQVYAQLARGADKSGDRAAATELRAKRAALTVPGGTNSDLKVFLTWDTDRSDIDLWVVTPKGERIWYSHRKGKHGGALYGDVTTGYGPETFSATKALPGTYTVIVNYFGTSRRGLREARGEVAIVLHEGTAREVRRVLPYRLSRPRQKVTVATIHIPAGRAL